MDVQASAYGYRLNSFPMGLALPDGLIQYQNSGRIEAEGLELEFHGRPTDWLETTVSYAGQKSRIDSGALSNSPNHIAKLGFAVPLGRKFDLSSSMQYASSRLTLADTVVTPVYLADFTLTSRHLLSNFDVRVGLRNAFGQKYSDPVALNPLVASMPQPGRSFFVELISHRASRR
jgi:outer membrane receptor protein involved in Fe transport